MYFRCTNNQTGICRLNMFFLPLRRIINLKNKGNEKNIYSGICKESKTCPLIPRACFCRSFNAPIYMVH